MHAPLACEFNRLCPFASAIYPDKFHTDDINLSRSQAGALIGQFNNFAYLRFKLCRVMTFKITTNMATSCEELSRVSLEIF